MAVTKEIKRRIKSIKNTKKITKAMELVAASKMKKAVNAALASRVYSLYSWNTLIAIKESLEEIKHPLFVETEKNKKTEKILLVLFTSNRGLCGAYNAQVLKKILFYLKNHTENQSIDILTVGKKGENAMRRLGQNIVATFNSLPDNNLTSRDAMPIAKIIIDDFMNQKYDKVLALYTDFISPLLQKPNFKQILPVAKETLKEFIEDVGIKEEGLNLKTENKFKYFLEGDLQELAGSLARKIIRMQIFQMLLESNASEQSARMIAMKNASDASGEMINDLTLVFNKARQAGITQEISEISAGMASVN